jgi:signal transduction histidine kinase
MEDRGTRSNAFGWPVAAWSGALVLYAGALATASPSAALLINNIAWTVAPLAAALAAWRTADLIDLTPRQRGAWRTVALACGSWLLGQLVWSYHAFFVDNPPMFPSLSKILYLGFTVLMLRALGRLSDSIGEPRFTMQHLGNLGLIGCCFAVTVVILFMEPVRNAAQPDFAVSLALAHCTFVALSFFAALYYLWTHKWHATWLSMLSLAVGTGTYGLGNFVYVRALLVGSYTDLAWVNATWVVAFLAVGLAAHLRSVTKTAADGLENLNVSSRRSRQLEATIPAMLIILMVVVGMSAPTQMTTRVLIATAILVLAFALILGAREAWIQGESQRLTRELLKTNELLRTTNAGLQESEARVRDLNAHLEERVADRTRQLQAAYEELEGFAYAVAHDLKAPLRTIDGFGHLLSEALSDRSDAQSAAYLARIRRGALKMAALIEDLLAYSRMERRALTPQSIELDKLIAEEIEEIAPEQDAARPDIRMNVPAIELHVDVEGLSLIVRNLLENAVKFSRAAALPRIDINARSIAERVELVIRDNGIGFDMQYQEQIFKLFHRLHRDDEYHGTGIGLALVRKALERMNGTIRAESEEGAGATFIVELPIAPR